MNFIEIYDYTSKIKEVFETVPVTASDSEEFWSLKASYERSADRKGVKGNHKMWNVERALWGKFRKFHSLCLHITSTSQNLRSISQSSHIPTALVSILAFKILLAFTIFQGLK